MSDTAFILMKMIKSTFHAILLFATVTYSGSYSTAIAQEASDLASKEELYEGPEFKKSFANPKDDPSLPRVLLIGDSISIAYTVDVRRRLAGKANVHRIPGNARTAEYGSKNLEKWLGDKKWDVIHFNWGLWDICHRHPGAKNQGNRDKINGTRMATPEEYRENMKKNLMILSKTGAKLIWCNTTPVPEGEAGRIVGEELKYNAITAEIIKDYDVTTNDLHSHALKKLPDIAARPGDVHFNKDGSAWLAEKIAEEILKVLP